VEVVIAKACSRKFVEVWGLDRAPECRGGAEAYVIYQDKYYVRSIVRGLHLFWKCGLGLRRFCARSPLLRSVRSLLNRTALQQEGRGCGQHGNFSQSSHLVPSAEPGERPTMLSINFMAQFNITNTDALNNLPQEFCNEKKRLS
jgi:hypothetical protein